MSSLIHPPQRNKVGASSSKNPYYRENSADGYDNEDQLRPSFDSDWQTLCSELRNYALGKVIGGLGERKFSQVSALLVEGDVCSKLG